MRYHVEISITTSEGNTFKKKDTYTFAHISNEVGMSEGTLQGAVVRTPDGREKLTIVLGKNIDDVRDDVSVKKQI